MRGRSSGPCSASRALPFCCITMRLGSRGMIGSGFFVPLSTSGLFPRVCPYSITALEVGSPARSIPLSRQRVSGSAVSCSGSVCQVGRSSTSRE